MTTEKDPDIDICKLCRQKARLHGIRSAETERTFSLEEVRGEIKKWATKSA